MGNQRKKSFFFSFPQNLGSEVLGEFFWPDNDHGTLDLARAIGRPLGRPAHENTIADGWIKSGKTLANVCNRIFGSFLEKERHYGKSQIIVKHVF